MSRFEFTLPDIGEGTAEAELVSWHVAIGDTIEEDAPLADVMTDKATVELSSPVSGKILSLNGSPGEQIAVGSVLIVFDLLSEDGNDAVPSPVSEPSPTTEALSLPAEVIEAVVSDGEPLAPVTPIHSAGRELAPNERPIASPSVRRRAFEAGVSLPYVKGSGPAGRIQHEDLDAWVSSDGRTGARLQTPPTDDVIQEVRVIGLRRKIAERMQDTKRRIPHFSYIEEIDVTALEQVRAELNGSFRGERPKLTLLPFIMRALVRSVPGFPQINARFDDAEGIVRHHSAVHIGIATQTPGGLMVPVVRHAEVLDAWKLAEQLLRVSAAARDGSITRDELSGSTITITSLGAIGGLATTPVINSPEVAIVGVNKIVERPVMVDGTVRGAKMMNLSCSFDHRVVDGWDAALFVQQIKLNLEHPLSLILDI